MGGAGGQNQSQPKPSLTQKLFEIAGYSQISATSCMLTVGKNSQITTFNLTDNNKKCHL